MAPPPSPIRRLSCADSPARSGPGATASRRACWRGCDRSRARRAPGSVWGDARAVNYAADAMARITSLTAFLSQWSSRSRAGGPENLATTSVPALLLTCTADQSTFPSTRATWLVAGGACIRNVDIVFAEAL